MFDKSNGREGVPLPSHATFTLAAVLKLITIA